jgi:hypothetical protein
VEKSASLGDILRFRIHFNISPTQCEWHSMGLYIMLYIFIVYREELMFGLYGKYIAKNIDDIEI